ncbi:MAG: DUF4118 domain-containing protein [Marinifilaceae bacterium]|nr:DUF4118 domain-containing protein [Marinifilaceae bacterium]
METKKKKKGKIINHYFFAVIIISLTVLICKFLFNEQGYHVVSFILLIVVSVLATYMSVEPVLLASTLSAIVWNYFFIPPHFTFHIEKPEDIFMFGMFFIIAFLNGILNTRVRYQEKLARDREERTNALFQLTKELSRAIGIEEVLRISINDIKTQFNIEPFFILQDGSNILFSKGRLRKDMQLSKEEYDVAEWAFLNKKKSGRHTEQTPSIRYTFFPLIGTRIISGIVAVKLDKLLVDDKKIIWDTFIAQISNALEREFLGELAQKARFLTESDRLYKTLFNSISHEFRIPVSTIIGSVDTLLILPDKGPIQLALYNEISTASLRLNRLIENLLNMSRLESGRISLRLDWYDINDLVNKVLDDLKEELKAFELEIEVPNELPLIRIDFGLMEQVLYNILFNATQYAPLSSKIGFKVSHKSNELEIRIFNSGSRIPENIKNEIFDKFYRLEENKTGGLGLGLSIVKGFVEAHRGQVRVENNTQEGVVFIVKIPSETPELDKKYIDFE